MGRSTGTWANFRLRPAVARRHSTAYDRSHRTADVQVKIDRAHNKRRLSHSVDSRRTAASDFGHRRLRAQTGGHSRRVGAGETATGEHCQFRNVPPHQQVTNRVSTELTSLPARIAVPPAPTFWKHPRPCKLTRSRSPIALSPGKRTRRRRKHPARAVPAPATR